MWFIPSVIDGSTNQTLELLPGAGDHHAELSGVLQQLNGVQDSGVHWELITRVGSVHQCTQSNTTSFSVSNDGWLQQDVMLWGFGGKSTGLV